MMQVLLTWHITNSANGWDILNGSLSGVFMILFSYHRFGWGCDLKKLSQKEERRKSGDDDEFDVRFLYLKEQIKQGCLEVGYGNHGCNA